jgi:general secretion pathway protein G
MAAMTGRMGGRARRGQRSGFSLLELMLVLAIMGILMAVVAINVLGTGDKAKIRATKASLQNIQTMLKSYHLEFSAPPPELMTLVATKALEKGKLKDAWGMDFLYDPNGTTVDEPYFLGSMGPDKRQGTPDDIDAWKMQD